MRAFAGWWAVAALGLALAGCGDNRRELEKKVETLEHENLSLTAKVNELKTHLEIVEGERDACKGIKKAPTPSPSPAPSP